MKTLIIKIGALGDVVRTTTLLKEIEGKIYWLTNENAKDLLNSKKISKVFFINKKEHINNLKKENFDLIISLDEELNALNLLRKLKTKKIIGVYLDKKDKIDYSSESEYWFDMSLISKKGIKIANILKEQNRKTVPEILIEMLGKKFKRQEYDLGVKPKKVDKNIIGIIKDCGNVWPNKKWGYYDELAEELERRGYTVLILGKRETLKQHIEDINQCKLIVCGDTLGMHIGLGLKKKVVALFNCTSPWEIEGYRRLTKIVSPLLKKFFYKREYNKEATEAIKKEFVLKKIEETLK